MSGDIRDVIERHLAFYEVLPYYVVVEERSRSGAVETRRIQAGFDIDLYGTKTVREPGTSPDYRLAYVTLRSLAEEVASHAGDSCCIDVMSFGATAVLDTSHHFQPEAMLRIRVTHDRGLDQPAGEHEASALREIEGLLHDLGVRAGNGRV